jgi:hypothetical protein
VNSLHFLPFHIPSQFTARRSLSHEIVGYVMLRLSHATCLGIKTKLHGLSPPESYTDLATAACRRSDFQLLRIESATWSA